MIPCPFKPGTSVALYLRHSPGEDQTIDSQRRAVRHWCDENALTIAEEFCDIAKSGASTSGREDFARMIDWLEKSRKAHPVAAVVVWSFSRFGRNFDDVSYYKGLLRRIGYDVFSMTEAVPRESVGRVIEAMHDWKSEADLERLSTDVKRGLRLLAEQGYAIGGFPPIGYRKSQPIEIGRKKNGEMRKAYRWEIDPATEERVRLAWRMKLAGADHWDIHRATNLCASPRGYTDLFRNESYTGTLKCGELRIPNTHPAYVTREEFDIIQAHRRDNFGRVQAGDSGGDHPTRRSPKNQYLLTGVLKCGFCGWSMVGNGNGEQSLYRCDWRHRAGKEKCQQPSIVTYAIDDAVRAWIASDIISYAMLQSIRDEMAAALNESNAALRARVLELKNDIAQFERQIANLLNAIERGAVGDEIQTRLASRRAEKHDAEVDLLEVQQKLLLGKINIPDAFIKRMAKEMEATLRSGHIETARPLVRLIAPKIELYKEKLRVHYTAEFLIEALALNASAERAKSVTWSVPPRVSVPQHTLLIHDLAIARPARGRGSPLYVVR